MTTIEPYAFCMQECIKKIVLHNDIISICDAAFMACSALNEVVIDVLERIGYCAFRQCKSLKYIDLPDGILIIIIMVKTMSIGRRILGVLLCLLMYTGFVALDLYNAARYKEVAYLNGGHLYTNFCL